MLSTQWIIIQNEVLINASNMNTNMLFTDARHKSTHAKILHIWDIEQVNPETDYWLPAAGEEGRGHKEQLLNKVQDSSGDNKNGLELGRMDAQH